MNMSDLKSIWELQSKISNKSVVRDSIILKNGIICYVGFIQASMNKIFQIEVNNSVSIHKNYLKRFHGVEIRVIESSGCKKDITIILSDNDLLDVFILFLEDLLKSLNTLSEENEAPLIVNQKVEYWERLFNRIRGELISVERQRGLYGELIFLNTLFGCSNDFMKTISSWTGPEGSNQDFSNELSAVEVKSSKATKPTVNISSELQLDWTKHENLFLHVIHLDELNSSSNTLMKLINEIKQKVIDHPGVLRKIEEKLDIAGISIGDEKLYDEIGYIIRSKRSYKVQNGFPSLTNDFINNDAIHNVKYQIDLTALGPFETELQFLLNKMT